MTSKRRRALIGATSLLAATGMALPALAQHMDHDKTHPPQAGEPAAMPDGQTTPAPGDKGMAGMDMPRTDMQGMDMAGMDMSGHHGMTSPYGPWPMSRDASGTSWQPQAAGHGGIHSMAGDWMVMSHALINLVYADQSGPRGDSKGFLAGMVMTTATRDWGPSKVTLRAMLSPDPLMGKDGYPLLLAAGESANGVDPLIDRQHPHDLFMELSASYSYSFGADQSVFVYAGLPGEPAFGPPAFMHRPAAVDSPEAPITHHWLDSTHITFGVVTAGYVAGPFKLEASQFRGREPDEKRYDIETGALDSSAVRFSYNPNDNWALQASWASINSPEALEPDEDERRVSLSALYSRRIGPEGKVSATLAWARKDRVPGDVSQAWLVEAAYQPDDRWTLFARAEQVDQAELTPGVHHGPQYTVRKASLGVIRDWRLGGHAKVGIGALVNGYDIPAPLSASYGDPRGGMVFMRLKIE
ncbi:MAG: hypothetical protein KF842_15640 [Caulobacter sp.]|nr:hypothetical protein [Caulobacter sp.]